MTTTETVYTTAEDFRLGDVVSDGHGHYMVTCVDRREEGRVSVSYSDGLTEVYDSDTRVTVRRKRGGVPAERAATPRLHTQEE